ncbi:peptidylprolyl isomerase [Candidatus Roizmanbacteria bacterium]|nr:peptidylprolyl isomerase [Candidatus Roizmanbacteria bacterium]
MKKEYILVGGTVLFIVILLGVSYILSQSGSKSRASEQATPTATLPVQPSPTEEVSTSSAPLSVTPTHSSPTPMAKKIEPTKSTQKGPLQKPSLTIDTSKTYTALVKTSEGTITIALNAKQTPITVNNFVYLSRQGFYDNSPFHRVINGFMIQGGDPTGTGMGGPGYKFDDESFTGEYTRGTIAMANSGPNTNGSQFFIMHKDYALPKSYVIFGKVTEGLDVVDKIATAPVTANQMGESSTPVNPVKILETTIIEK